jgi:TetR/AcrR family transcriptional regulator
MNERFVLMEEYSLIDEQNFEGLLRELEREGRVTRTFRRLDPERQNAVIRAIFEDALENGPAALNIKRVAGRAGVAVGSLYQYFGSREGLLDFTIELVVRASRASFEAYRGLLEQLPLREALEAYVQGGLEWSKRMPGFTHFYARAAYSGDPALVERVVRPVAETMLGMVQGILEGARERGELGEGLDVEAAARVIYALSIALIDPLLLPYLNAYFQVSSAGCPAERTLEAAVEMMLRGLRREK